MMEMTWKEGEKKGGERGDSRSGSGTAHALPFVLHQALPFCSRPDLEFVPGGR